MILVGDIGGTNVRLAIAHRGGARVRLDHVGRKPVRDFPGLEEAVSTRTQVNTLVANPFATMQTSPRIQMKRLMVDAPSLIVACGLAMRRFDPV